MPDTENHTESEPQENNKYFYIDETGFEIDGESYKMVGALCLVGGNEGHERLKSYIIKAKNKCCPDFSIHCYSIRPGDRSKNKCLNYWAKVLRHSVPNNSMAIKFFIYKDNDSWKGKYHIREEFIANNMCNLITPSITGYSLSSGVKLNIIHDDFGSSDKSLWEKRINKRINTRVSNIIRDNQGMTYEPGPLRPENITWNFKFKNEADEVEKILLQFVDFILAVKRNEILDFTSQATKEVLDRFLDISIYGEWYSGEAKLPIHRFVEENKYCIDSLLSKHNINTNPINKSTIQEMGYKYEDVIGRHAGLSIYPIRQINKNSFIFYVEETYYTRGDLRKDYGTRYYFCHKLKVEGNKTEEEKLELIPDRR